MSLHEHEKSFGEWADSQRQTAVPTLDSSAWLGEMEAECKRGERNARGAKMSGNVGLEKEWSGYTNGIKVALNAWRRLSPNEKLTDPTKLNRTNQQT